MVYMGQSWALCSAVLPHHSTLLCCDKWCMPLKGIWAGIQANLEVPLAQDDRLCEACSEQDPLCKGNASQKCDIVDTTFHTSSATGQMSTKQGTLPFVWERADQQLGCQMAGHSTREEGGAPLWREPRLPTWWGVRAGFSKEEEATEMEGVLMAISCHVRNQSSVCVGSRGVSGDELGVNLLLYGSLMSSQKALPSDSRLDVHDIQIEGAAGGCEMSRGWSGVASGSQRELWQKVCPSNTPTGIQGVVEAPQREWEQLGSHFLNCAQGKSIAQGKRQPKRDIEQTGASRVSEPQSWWAFGLRKRGFLLVGPQCRNWWEPPSKGLDSGLEMVSKEGSKDVLARGWDSRDSESWPETCEIGKQGDLEADNADCQYASRGTWLHVVPGWILKATNSLVMNTSRRKALPCEYADRGLPWFQRVTGNKGSIPEREPEKRLPHPRKAAGAQITQSRHGEVVTINNNMGLFWVS
ncbi:hypothetical protein BD414DRAFT_570982 [Trametes punicea]|nr:hypothetical protein BD414DRAFT_570982 [Trametes punicea]